MTESNRTLHFATALESWLGFEVVRFAAREAVNELFCAEVLLRRSVDDGPADLDQLLGGAATVRIAHPRGVRMVHGLLAELEELDETKLFRFYRALLVPHFYPATHRKRCRTFVDCTLEEIVTAVLEARETVTSSAGAGGLTRFDREPKAPPAEQNWNLYDVPTGAYRIDLRDTARWTSRDVRPYIVQYNETDFDFLCRLLEEQGLSFVFEADNRSSVLTITDSPCSAPLFDEQPRVRRETALSGVGPRDHEVLYALRKAARLRPRRFSVGTWDERVPVQTTAIASVNEAYQDQSSRYEFPSRDLGDPQSAGNTYTTVRLERASLERALREARGNVACVVPNTTLTAFDQTGARDDEHLKVLAVETRAVALSPEGLEGFEGVGAEVPCLGRDPDGRLSPARVEHAQVGQYICQYLLAPADLIVRPAQLTPVPRIDGVHAAIVSAKEAGSPEPEIHCNEDGWVRLWFPWDQRSEESKPTSCWVRASQGWAGAGFGVNFIPRVGQEVLVAYYQGDVERPVIVGRVHDPIQPTPYKLPEHKTRSTLKTKSSPDSEGFNELRFEDKAGEEEVFLHAQKDLNEVVLASHSTSVGGDQSNSVEGDQSNEVHGDRQNEVSGHERHHISGTRDVTVDSSHAMHQESFLSESKSFHRFRDQRAVFEDSTSFEVESPWQAFTGEQAFFDESAEFFVKAGAAKLQMKSGFVSITNGAGARIVLDGSRITIEAATVTVKGTSHLALSGGVASLEADGNLDVHAGGVNRITGSPVKLNP
ncbi:MAG: type VI secretion system tip protein TssI/VgrG [Polyangiaceae bacterium]